MVVIALIIAVALLINHWGILLRRRGMLPIDNKQLVNDELRTTTTKDGRTVSYCVYGSDEPSAPVVVNMHGSGLECGFERSNYAHVCQALHCRGIAISLPGCGFSDEKPGRRVVDWPAEDLEAVLNAENVNTFHITGHSQGTPHAMAAALHFKERCIGLGLNAPLLPTKLCRELGTRSTIGTGGTPTSTKLYTYAMGWYFSFFQMVFGLLPPKLASTPIRKGFPKVQADKELINKFENSMRRAVVRGTTGATWETAQDTCFEWGFDVRDLKHRNAHVWHSEDDSAIPFEQGQWLAEHLNASYKSKSEGYGHMTYCAGKYLEPKHSLIAALILN
ncbi:alpha/beta hydrolase [Vibrio barjaei]|uniref:alpha/beta hydrolase n=1 Tax=Vibrio barjaei TaxID=1676683 RepID=UPI002283681A|nr:alpha/beta hydrolase [Vibrio barjaei]MCY9870470.1 alpha/beta hydrolase [Vibrio barjaei]